MRYMRLNVQTSKEKFAEQKKTLQYVTLTSSDDVEKPTSPSTGSLYRWFALCHCQRHHILRHHSYTPYFTHVF